MQDDDSGYVSTIFVFLVVQDKGEQSNRPLRRELTIVLDVVFKLFSLTVILFRYFNSLFTPQTFNCFLVVFMFVTAFFGHIL